jgi:hypothetical protein
MTSKNVLHSIFIFHYLLMSVTQRRVLICFACKHAELDGTMRSPLRVLKSGALALQFESSSLPKSSYATEDSTCTGGAPNLFMLPLEKLPLLVPSQYAVSDQDLLLEIPLNARHPEAELLCQPSQLMSSITSSSTSMGGVAEGEGYLKQP